MPPGAMVKSWADMKRAMSGSLAMQQQGVYVDVCVITKVHVFVSGVVCHLGPC